MTFRNILLNGTTDAMQIKGRVQSKFAVVSDIVYEDIVFRNLTRYHDSHDDPAMAVRIEMLYGGGGVVDPVGATVRGLTLRNFSGDSLTAGVIHCRAANPYAFRLASKSIMCCPYMLCEYLPTCTSIYLTMPVCVCGVCGGFLCHR